jgi:myo-inositol-1(or 4)-monophosphatase
MNDIDRYQKVANSAAKEAGVVFKKYFGNPGKVEYKRGNPRDLVTKIDRQIETLIRKKIGKNFPAHKIVGEEFANGKTFPDDFVWYIDPIDGTSNFIHGFPFCCTSIALWDKNGPLIAVLYNPVLDMQFTAARGRGAFLNGKKIKVNGQTDMACAFGGYGWGRNIGNASKHFPKLVKDLNKIRTIGTTALEVCLVAKGVYSFHIQAEVKIWDFAAAILILQEAGGKVTDWQGRPLTANSTNLVASNGKMQGKLLAAIKKI